MAYNSHKGWYKLVNPQKFIPPLDGHMQSYNNGAVNFKSRLELHAFKYADFNKHVKHWSIEPFPIHYIKPSDGKQHRYYIDLFLEFTTGDKFIVEVKSKGETELPKPPKKPNEKNLGYYQTALMTYAINQAKWAAARDFAEKNDIKFIILSEDVLSPRVAKTKKM